MKLYTLPSGCKPCERIKGYVEYSGVEGLEIVSLVNQRAYEELAKAGIRTVPALQLDHGDFVVGEENIKQAIDEAVIAEVDKF